MATQPKSTSHVAADLLARAHCPDIAETILREKVKQRPLLLRPTSPDPTLNARAKRQYERQQKAKAQRKTTKPRPLSAAQKRKLSLYDIPPPQRKYSIYEPVHAMWCAYMRDILALSGGKRTHVDAQSAGPILVSADYHGALLEVVRSRCPSRVGLKGIVVKDTKFTFELVTKGDAVKTVPKEYTVFRLEVPLEEKQDPEGLEMTEDRRPMVFEIHGNQFETRAPDRANRKFRWHFDPDL